MDSLVSILLPVYNGERTLGRTLASLEKQTYPNVELLVCIDGSTDRSFEILSDYANRNRNTRIFVNSENLGLGPTLNRLVYESKGEFCAIAEQDDVYPKCRIRSQVEALLRNPQAGLVSGIAEFVDYEPNATSGQKRFPGLLEKGGQYPVNADALFLLNYVQQIKVVNSAMMFRRKTHVDNGLYFSKHYGSVSVDWSYVLRFSKRSGILGLNQTLVYLDRTPSRANVTSNKRGQFAAARELLRSFRFEEPRIVTPAVYREALKNQLLLELGYKTRFSLPISAMLYTFLHLDTRFCRYLLARTRKAAERMANAA